MKNLIKIGSVAFAVFFALMLVIVLSKNPENNKDWTLDQSILPTIGLSSTTISINNIRDFEYRSTAEYTPRYTEQTFDISDIQGVDFIIEDLAKPGMAHTFLSFKIDDKKSTPDYIAISAEIRKEKGEVYSPLKGMLREFELMYVIATERDVIGLRRLHRGHDVRIYPTIATPEQSQKLLVAMLARAHKLQQEPEFYNTLTSTCTTNIVSHINDISPNRVPFRFSILAPRNIDAYAYELGLISTSTSFEVARENALIPHITAIDLERNGTDFSSLIRTNK